VVTQDARRSMRLSLRRVTGFKPPQYINGVVQKIQFLNNNRLKNLSHIRRFER
jgi:hypothetical protein